MHESGEVAIDQRPEYKVEMVRHKAVRHQLNGRSPLGPTNQLKEPLVVAWRIK
jgi:hypothetical protein